MSEPYTIGQLVRVSGPFRNLAGAAVDPTVVTFAFRTPEQSSSQETVYTYPVDAQLVRDSAGNYHVDLSVTLAGVWWYRWAGTGALVAADEGAFSVEPSQF